MRRIVVAVLAIVSGISLLFLPVASRNAISAPASATSSPNLLYIAATHLWLRPINGGPAQRIATPWPAALADKSFISDLQWAPDAQRVALDDVHGRLAVVNLATGRSTVVLGTHCSKNCSMPTFQWSPNGRYLAFMQPTGKGATGVLRVWDSGAGTTRRLLGHLAGYVATPQWSHDSSRVAIETGTFDTMKSMFPQAVAVDLAGHVVHLGSGLYLSWSPDDRLIGIIRPNFCGANTCDEDELVESSAGGAPVLLARHASSLFDNPIWAPQGGGYAFDRWLLDASGHPKRRLAGPHERILTWKPDGSRVALQTYYPYQGTPDALYLSTPTGQRIHLYTDGRNSGCGACSKDTYSVAWTYGDVFAFYTPTYPNPKDVTVFTRYFVSSIANGARTRIGIPGSSDITNILGFANGGRTVVIHGGGTVYRYTVASHGLAKIATGLVQGYSTAILDPREEPTSH
ncbi:MAG: hypothetical protein NVSMB52_12890 [Chloroflexota bacterium]